MQHYTFSDTFRELYDHAVKRYQSGHTDWRSYFNAEQLSFLAAAGITAQHLFDYAEDYVGNGEPGYDRALAIELVRRDYFLNVQQGQPSTNILDVDAMPAKFEEVQGIAWLPRLMPKARAKLRGELPCSLMYGCGGDRGFFKNHDIHPAEFLSLVWRLGDDDAAIVAWVAARSRKR
ncbi:MAG: DUF5069 domain-containing protein [Candidatus Didemnitutus sp.]|nr:DUF5069 domain-containing protein [Candidatus Didemnitutus sp.]